jgi:tRNA(Ile)-lysidine synthase TilS/MesJ
LFFIRRNYDPNIGANSQEAQRLNYERDLERTLRETRGGKDYDAVICLSGGKDSLYLLYRAVKDYGLRVLAFTIDANIPDVAWASIRKAIEVLQVDHLVYRPPVDFYRKLFPLLVAKPGVARCGLHDLLRLCATF